MKGEIAGCRDVDLSENRITHSFSLPGIRVGEKHSDKVISVSREKKSVCSAA